MSSKIIIPLLNKNITLFSGPTWYLSKNLSIETISPDDYYTISNYASSEYKSLLNTKTKCARIENVNSSNVEKFAITEASKLAFILNYFKKDYPIAISFGFEIISTKKPRLEKTIDFSVTSDAQLQRNKNYKIREHIKREDITQYYKILGEAYSKNNNLILTLDRFNSALFKSELFDKIIDITISLESLIDGTTELRNRFSLYNSWAAEGDDKKREETFNMLLNLYDARSAIVHGTTLSDKEYIKKIQPVEQNWDKIITIAERAIGYYLFYIFQFSPDNWRDHQKKLALGIENRIV